MTHNQAPQPEPSRQPDSMNAAPHPSEITDLPRRLAFLDIDEADRQRLRELAPQLKPSAAAFVETFYRHLFAFEETARFLHEPALVERLKQSQQSTWSRCWKPNGTRPTFSGATAWVTSMPTSASARRCF